jgi:predicted ATPase
MPPVYSLVDLGSDFEPRYRLRFSDGDLIRSGQPSDALQHLLWHINSETFRRTGDFLLIHAGAVVSPTTGNAILLPGAAGSGKTTLVAGLVSQGFDYLSDEAAAIDPVTNLVYPFPKALTFKTGSLEALAAMSSAPVGSNGAIDGQRHVLVEELRVSSVAKRPSPTRTIVSIKYESGAHTEVQPMSRASAAVTLAESALNMRTYRERGLELIGRVVRQAGCYRLVSGDLLEAVAAISKVAV